MDPAMWVVILGVVIGIIAYVKYRSNLVPWAVAAIMIGGGLFAPTYINDMFEAEAAPSAGITASSIGFDIDVQNATIPGANLTKVSIADDEKSATFALSVIGDGNEFTGENGGVNFTFTPIPSVGATSEDLVTIYFETDYLMSYGGEDVLVESSGTYFANWTYAAGDNDQATADYKGTMSLIPTETAWCEIWYKLDGGNDTFGEEVDAIGDSGNWHIYFHNADNSWQETFTVNWICVAV